MMAEPLPPGSVIGIVGGGQLGRMLAQAAAKLGFKASIFAPEADSPAFDVAAFQHCARYDDAEALERFADEADAVTFEFENIPAAALAIIEQRSHLAPPRLALEVAQDRLAERRFLTGLGLPVAPFAEVMGGAGLRAAYETLPGGRAFLKRAREGYDGKGQMRLADASALPDAERWLGDHPALLEAEVPYRLELSAICVRDGHGSLLVYDPPQNTHREGILRESLVPAPISAEIAQLARDYAARIAEALDYVGVLAVEMFLNGGDAEPRLLINEIAPRVHNSGHWTAEACAVSQFENHIRAVAGWPLGSTGRHSNAKMVNLLGTEADGWRGLIEDNSTRSLTLYGKKEGRAGRKMGHYVDLSPLTR
ncbi:MULTISPECIES: 5-(carboxyamino)imidazole ribonucleotide synthase [Rhodomicrobium]|uniref:5-(carboxyamino)imidazole ribonucleotide synthase n=1 Tax=Rhodomicrobium TaxID=1068 RepID=UPI001AEC81FA|nr:MULTISPECIES: 5-(carboxyamino)imidazole ribonucleotide synthase [Rhodomicrobium]